MTPIPGFRKLTRRGAILILAKVLVLVVAVGAGWWLLRGLFDPQYSLTLSVLLDGDPALEQSAATDITPQACREEIPCVEAYDTREATYYRFASREDATMFASAVVDGFQSNYIVMDFDGKTEANKTEQLWAMQRLAGTWVDYHDGYPDR